MIQQRKVKPIAYQSVVILRKRNRVWEEVKELLWFVFGLLGMICFLIGFAFAFS
jgi:hypothetical protein